MTEILAWLDSGWAREQPAAHVLDVLVEGVVLVACEMGVDGDELGARIALVGEEEQSCIEPTKGVGAVDEVVAAVGLPGGWQLRGLTDLDAIRARFEEIGATGDMVACGPSGLTVVDLDLDLDVKGNGEANWAAAGGAAHAAFEVRTWSGGRHLYFRSAGAHNTSGRPGGVDVRGIGGGVFGPGSVVLGLDGTVAGDYSILAGSAVRSSLMHEPANLASIVGAVRPSSTVVEGERAGVSSFSSHLGATRTPLLSRSAGST